LIPAAYIQEWRKQAPWPNLNQVEQDLIISRALCDLFNAPSLAGKIAFRGGTAINKLLFQRAYRYSEDIDLVQMQPEPIGSTIDATRDALAWLGRCDRQQAGHSTHLLFKFAPEANPQSSLKVKIEINTREHVSVYGVKAYPFVLNSRWHSARTSVLSFEPEELFGTKLRALLQRWKNRDLFDLYIGLKELPLDTARLMACFEHYLALEGRPITRANAEQRMLGKLSRSLTEDVSPLLPVGVQFDENAAVDAFSLVWRQLIARIEGSPWKSSGQVIEELRNGRIPNLLCDKQKGDSFI